MQIHSLVLLISILAQCLSLMVSLPDWGGGGGGGGGYANSDRRVWSSPNLEVRTQSRALLSSTFLTSAQPPAPAPAPAGRCSPLIFTFQNISTPTQSPDNLHEEKGENCCCFWHPLHHKTATPQYDAILPCQNIKCQISPPPNHCDNVQVGWSNIWWHVSHMLLSLGRITWRESGVVADISGISWFH